MSQLVGGAMPQFRLERKGDSAHSVGWVAVTDLRPQVFGYSNQWWPSRGGFAGDLGLDISVVCASLGWGEFEIVGGESSRVGFVGVTRDSTGSPLGGCVVQLFRTTDDLFIMEVTSDSTGNFLLQSWYSPDTHYIVAYKAGSPDVFGTTVNTLVGA